MWCRTVRERLIKSAMLRVSSGQHADPKARKILSTRTGAVLRFSTRTTLLGGRACQRWRTSHLHANVYLCTTQHSMSASPEHKSEDRCTYREAKLTLKERGPKRKVAENGWPGFDVPNLERLAASFRQRPAPSIVLRAAPSTQPFLRTQSLQCFEAEIIASDGEGWDFLTLSAQHQGNLLKRKKGPPLWSSERTSAIPPHHQSCSATMRRGS